MASRGSQNKDPPLPTRGSPCNLCPPSQALGVLLWCISWADLFYSFHGLLHGQGPAPVFFVTPLVVGVTMVSVVTREAGGVEEVSRECWLVRGWQWVLRSREDHLGTWAGRKGGRSRPECPGCCGPLPAQLLATLLIQYERLRGVQSSGILIIFWFLCVVCAIIPFRSKILAAMAEVRERGGKSCQMQTHLEGDFRVQGHCWLPDSLPTTPSCSQDPLFCVFPQLAVLLSGSSKQMEKQ